MKAHKLPYSKTETVAKLNSGSLMITSFEKNEPSLLLVQTDLNSATSLNLIGTKYQSSD